MNKPALLYTSPGGATIHSYPLTGGKREFERYLECYLGTCVFHNTLKEAKEAVRFWHNFVKPITYWERFAIPPWHPQEPCHSRSLRSLCLHIVALITRIIWYIVRWLSECEARAVWLALLMYQIVCSSVPQCLHIDTIQLASWLQSVTMYWHYIPDMLL